MKELKRLLCMVLIFALICPTAVFAIDPATDSYLVKVTKGFSGYSHVSGPGEYQDPEDINNSVGRYYGVNTSMKWYNPRAYFDDDGASPKVLSGRAMITTADGSYFEYRLRGSANNPLVQLNGNQTISVMGQSTSLKWVTNKWIGMYTYIDYSAIDTESETPNYICPVRVYLASDGGITDADGNVVNYYTDTEKTIDMSGYVSNFGATGNNRNSVNASGVIQKNSECAIYLDDTFVYIPAPVTASYVTNEEGNYTEELTVKFSHAVDMSTVTKENVKVTSAGGVPVAIDSITCKKVESDTFTIKFAQAVTASGQYIVDLSKVVDITGAKVAENLKFNVEGMSYLPIEKIDITTEDAVKQVYGHTFPVEITAATTPVDGIRAKNVTWYVDDEAQSETGLELTCNFDNIGTYNVYAKDSETGVTSNTITITVEEEKDDTPNRDSYGMDVTKPGAVEDIPVDWKMLIKDDFKINSQENIALQEYKGGTGFASDWSADLACTDNSENTFKTGQYSGKTYSNPYIGVRDGESYLARHISNSSNQAQAEFRKMNTPINLAEDGEYYVMFDMALSNSSNVGTAQRFGFVDSTDGGKMINVGSHAQMFHGKMGVNILTGEWGIGDARRTISPQPTKLSPVNGLYTMVVHISARATGNDVIRYRVFFDEVDEEKASFFPEYWSTEISANLNYHNLDTVRFSCGNGTGSGYTGILDNLVMYSSSPVIITSDYANEPTLVAGRTLTATVAPVNSLGNAQKISYIGWYDYTNPESATEPISASASFTIPESMTGRKLLCLVTIKDLITGDLTTYAPVNRFVRAQLDLQQTFLSPQDCKGGLGVDRLDDVTEAYIRFDVTRNDSNLKDGYVKVGVQQYSELGTLKKTHTIAAVKASSLPVGSTNRMVVNLIADDGMVAEAGDEFKLVAKYIPGDVADSDALLTDETGYDLPFASEVTDTEMINTKYTVPGGTQVKIGETWRSALYPVDWEPGYLDEKGRGLQDFSYAGYRKGEAPIPDSPTKGNNVYNVLTYGADPTGNTDSTADIQAAIDAAGRNGGGVVYMPEGEYSITYVEGKDYALRMDKSNVVLKGAGDGKTFLYLNETFNRQKNAIYMGGGKTFYAIAGNETLLTKDITAPTHAIHVASTAGFTVGDTICIGSEKRVTQEFCDEHYMTSWYNADGSGKLDSVIFMREITAIDTANNIIYIDIPTRYYILMRDGAKIFKPYERTYEQGIEDFSIRTKENTKDGIGETDYNNNTTCAYETYCSYFILVRGATDGWIRNISTYQGKDNSKYGSHIASNVICIHQSNRITIENVHCKNTRYQGGGGNGYAFDIQGADCLFKDCTTYNTRHGYSFKSMQTTGNVIYNCSSENNKYVDDFHQHLSNANLIDNHYFMTGDRPRFEATNNGTYGSVPHGYTTTESTFWNCQTTVVSKQVGMGYAIGCWAVDSSVGPTDNSNPADYVEGTGKGASLMPQSLYMDQKNRRLNENQVIINQVYFADENNSNQNEIGLTPIKVKTKAVVSYNDELTPPVLLVALYESKGGATELASLQLVTNPVDYVYETDYFDLTGKDTSKCYIKIFAVDDPNSLTPLLEKPMKFDSDGLIK